LEFLTSEGFESSAVIGEVTQQPGEPSLTVE